MDGLTEKNSPIYNFFQKIDGVIDDFLFSSSSESHNNWFFRIFYCIVVLVIRILFYLLTLTIIPQIIFQIVLRFFSISLMIFFQLYSLFSKEVPEYLHKLVAANAFLLKNIFKSRKFHVWSCLQYFSLSLNFIFGILIPFVPDLIFKNLYQKIKTADKIYSSSSIPVITLYTIISLFTNLACIEIIVLLYGSIPYYSYLLLFIVLSLIMAIIFRDLTENECDNYFTEKNDFFNIKGKFFNLFEQLSIDWN